MKEKDSSASTQRNATIGKTEELNPSLLSVLHDVSEQSISSSYNSISANPYLSRSSFSERSHIAAKKRKKALVFKLPGSIVEQAEEIRRNNELSKLDLEVSKEIYEAGLATAVVNDLFEDAAHIPQNSEWWDAPFLQASRAYTTDTSLLDLKFITALIHRPSLILGSVSKVEDLAKPIPLHLTKQEMKKRRSIERKARQLELQEQIQLGLVDRPPDKVRIRNLTNVLANTSSADPTAVENEVRAAIEERKLKHISQNTERKLTSAESSLKKRLAAAADVQADSVVQCAVFKIVGLPQGTSFAKIRYKIAANARQLFVCGCFLVDASVLSASNEASTRFHVIVAQGGEKGMRKFKNLLLSRISWSDFDLNFHMTWEGTAPSASFSKFQYQEFDGQFDLRKYLADLSLDHFYSVNVF